MSRSGMRHSPVPHLISDAELNEFPKGIGLRSRGLDAAGQPRITVWYVNPTSGIKGTIGGYAVARQDILANLRSAADLLKSKQRAASTLSDSSVLSQSTPVGAVARLWRRDAEQNGYWTKRGRRRAYRASTMRNKDNIYNAHLAGKKGSDGTLVKNPHRLLNYSVGAVTSEDLTASFASEWKMLGETTKAKLHTLLTEVFEFARRNGAITVNPMSDVPGYDGQGRADNQKYLSLDEIRLLLSAIPQEDGEWAEAKVRHANYYRIHIKALLFTAPRINELASLRWQDVVLDSAPCSSYFVIRQQRDGSTTTGTKTKSGTRCVYLTDDLAQDLRVHRETQYRHWERVRTADMRDHAEPTPHPNPNDFVFTSPWGKPLDVRQFRKVLDKMARAAGLTDHIHPHYLRHTSLTYWADASEGNAKVRDAIAGWGDSHVSSRYIAVPRSRLIRATRIFQREVADKVLSIGAEDEART